MRERRDREAPYEPRAGHAVSPGDDAGPPDAAGAWRPGQPVALGGRIRHEPDDFVVEEIPLFAPLGVGEYVLARVEKRGLSTLDTLLFLSKALKVSERTIGYAGLKDARALTTQTVSVPRMSPERVRSVGGPRFRILSAARHPHGLKIGHLGGNRFTIRIRGADLARVPAAEAALADLVRRGMPNPYGEQRFGTKLDSHLLGRAIVDEDWAGFVDLLLGHPSALEKDQRMHAARNAWTAGRPEEAFALLPKKHRSEKRALAELLRTGSPREAFDALGPHPKRIWVSAWQSWLFNRVLERRRADGTWDRLLPGDVAWLHASGAMLEVGSGPEEAERAAALVASATGPLPGYDQRLASGAPGALERDVLRAEGADPEAFRAAHARMRGSRRPLRVPVREASLAVEAPAGPEAAGGIGNVLVRFVLPPGAFATVLLDLLMAGPGPRGPVLDQEANP
jgi:tRNA pseudouridine13 synthase